MVRLWMLAGRSLMGRGMVRLVVLPVGWVLLIGGMVRLVRLVSRMLGGGAVGPGVPPAGRMWPGGGVVARLMWLAGRRRLGGSTVWLAPDRRLLVGGVARLVV
jgi:hypothetical protein